MAERSSLKPAAISAPTLTPQGQLAGKPAMPLSRPFTLIGSRNRAHLHLISSSVSRNHCCIIVTDNGLYLRDLASRTGAIVNGRRVKESDLRDGDVIQVGSFKFKFADPAGPVRFPITPKAAGAVLHFSGVNTEIDSRTLTIGRRSNCDIALDDDAVSNSHAIVFESNGERFIRDLGSRTGTLVNGRPIHHQLLNFGDTIRIGATDIHYNPNETADDVSSQSESELESLGLEPIELEPIELDPTEEEAVESVAPPTPAFPRMVDLSRRVPLDKDPGDLVDDEETSQPIEVADTGDLHEGNGAIPIEVEESTASAHDELIALEPVELEPVAEATSSVPSAASFTLVPAEPDPKADSIYAMNFASTPEIFTAPAPTEPAPPELAEAAAAEESAIPLAENIAEPTPLETAEPERTPSVLNEDFEPEQQPLAIEEVEAPESASEPELAVTDQVTDSDAVEQGAPASVETEQPFEPEPFAADPAIEEAGFTAPAEVEPDVVAESSTDDPRASEQNDFTPTLDVVSANSPTAFEGLPASEEGSATPISQTQEPIEPPPPTTDESPADDTAWTLSVGSVEESGTAPTSTEAQDATEVEPTDAAIPAAERIEQSHVTADASNLPGEVDVTTSTTVEHPVRPELPPDTETPTPAVGEMVVIPPLPAPDFISAAGVAAAVIAIESPAPKRGRGRPKAEPKPAPAPKGGRKKKTSDVTPVVAEAPAPVVEDPAIQSPPTPGPKKRGGSRKKAGPPLVQSPAVEMEPVETNSSTETPAPIEEPSAVGEPLAEAPGEMMSDVESLTADATVPPETTESQDITNSVSESAFGVDEAGAPRVAEELSTEIPEPEAVAEIQLESSLAAEPGSIDLESDSALEHPGSAAGIVEAATEPDLLETVSEAQPVEASTEESISETPAADIEIAPIEVLEPTDPTPESAQVLEPELVTPEQGDEPQLDETMAGLSLTDTAFGRAVVDLGSADSAPLVEETSPQPLDEEPPTEVAVSAEIHHVTAADELPAPGQESFDVTLPVDDAVGTAANDTLIQAGEKVESAVTESDEQDTEAVGQETDSDFAIPEIERAAHVDLVDDSAAPDASIGPVVGIDPITLEPDVRAAEAVAEEHEAQLVAVPEIPASAAGDDFDLPPDVDLNIDLGGEDESGRGLGNDDIELITPPETGSEPALDHAFEPESLSSANVSQPQPASQPPAAPAVQSAPAPNPSTDPFFGMNRDLASFLGGVPLTLTSATPIAPVADSGLNTAFSTSAFQGSPSTSPATSKQVQPQPTPPPTDKVAELEDDIPEIDFSTTDEPLDLFEDAPHKLDEMPDSLEPISDVSHVLSPAGKPAPKPPGPPAPPVSQPLLHARPAPPPMRSVTPPPPPKSSPLRSFTSNISVTPPPMVPGAGAPVSFGGAPAAAGLTAPFGALGTPQTRQVDVFSHTAFPPLDPSVFSAPQRPASPRAVTPGAASQRRDAQEEETSTADDVLAIELDSLPDLVTTPVRRTAIPPNQQTPTARPPAAPVKKPWWKSLKILLPLVILAIIVVILVVMFFPPKHTVQGTLQIQGLDRDNLPHRSSQVAMFRKLISNPDVRSVAASNVKLKEHGITPGFLNDPEALIALGDSTNSPFNDSTGQLVLNRRTTDVDGDRVRMRALVDAVYRASGKHNDEAAISLASQKRAAADAADEDKQRQAQQKVVDGVTDQLLASGGAPATNWIVNPQAAVAQVQVDEADARQAVDAATADVQKKRESLQQIQSAAAPADANVAAESQRVKKAIADLNVHLDAVRLAEAGHADDSAKVFATSLDGIDKALNDAAGGTLAPAPVTDARNAVAEIRELDGNLAAKTRDDSKSVAQLRRQIADRRESHLRQIWSGDPSLQALVEERNAQSHRYGAAIDSNYVDEAAKIKGVLEELDRKIEARRSELATGSQFADQLQQTLQQTIDRTEAARQGGEAQMTHKLQLLATMFSGSGAAAAILTAPKLSQAASDALVARQAYAAAASLSATTADAEARRLQLQIAEQQARLDSLQQEPGNTGPVETARRALDAAQAAEAKATASFTTTHNNLTLLQQLASESTKLNAKIESSKLAQKTADEKTASPELVEPNEASVSPIYARDQRFIYLIGGLAGVLLVFAGPLWMTVHDMSRDKQNIPDAMPRVEPIHDPRAPALISSDSDSLFAADTAHV